MEDGPHGLIGLHAVPPVAQECAKEAESATTLHHTMMGTTVMVWTVKLTSAMKIHVLVSPLANKVL